jgi:hypothetical protein
MVRLTTETAVGPPRHPRRHRLVAHLPSSSPSGDVGIHWAASTDLGASRSACGPAEPAGYSTSGTPPALNVSRIGSMAQIPPPRRSGSDLAARSTEGRKTNRAAIEPLQRRPIAPAARARRTVLGRR